MVLGRACLLHAYGGVFSDDSDRIFSDRNWTIEKSDVLCGYSSPLKLKDLCKCISSPVSASPKGTPTIPSLSRRYLTQRALFRSTPSSPMASRERSRNRVFRTPSCFETCSAFPTHGNLTKPPLSHRTCEHLAPLDH